MASVLPFRSILVLAAAVLAFAAPVSAQAPTYPILVYSTSTGQHDVPVSINVAQASQAVRLCATTHQAGYHVDNYVWSDWNRRDDAAGLQLNGGSMTANWNSTGTVEAPADHYEGIGGAYHTVRVCFPVNGGAGSLGIVSEGSNTVTFRFYGVRDIARSGYRVLEIDVEDASGNDLITSESRENPETWTIANTVGSAYDNPTAINQGRTLWQARNSLTEINGSASLTAACSDCHATSGYDLKYFNYEPEVIETRARHHGLTDDEAKKIAAYILSIDLGRTDGRETTPLGRPWNPPYQPGPGLSSGLEEDWTAGAGVGWVLAHDHETFDYLFSSDGVTPNTSPSYNDMLAAFEIGTYSGTSASDWGHQLPVADIPVAIQYPDWNNWLPDVHPLDGYSGYSGSQLQTDVETTLPNAFDTPGEVASAASSVGDWLARGLDNPQPSLKTTTDKVNYEHDDWPLKGTINHSCGGANPARHYLEQASLAQFLSVKSWEVFATNRMFDLADEIAFGRTMYGGEQGAGEPIRVMGSVSGQEHRFFWPSNQSVVYDIAPHKSDGDCTQFPQEGTYGPNSLMNDYFSTAWYDVQLAITSENVGYGSGSNPVDWAYMAILARDTQARSGVSQWARMVRQRAFAYQSRNNVATRNAMLNPVRSNDGFAARVPTSIWYTMGEVGRFWDPNASQPEWQGTFHDDQAEARDVVAALAESWGDFTQTVTVADWPRASNNDRAWEPASYTPIDYTSGYKYYNNKGADNVWRFATDLAAQGYASAAASLAVFGEGMWPNGNWEQWISSNPSPNPPTVDLVQPTTGANYDAPASITLAATAVTPGANITRIRFLNGSTVIGTVTSAPYTMTWNGIAAGNYTLKARVEDSLGRTAVSSSVSITVTDIGPDPTTGEQTITLGEGWNLVSSYIAPSDSSMATIWNALSDEALLVRDAQGHEFIPSDGTGDLEYWHHGEGYQVNMAAPATLTLQGEVLAPEATPLPLHEGWNQIAFLGTNQVAVTEALEVIIPSLVMAKTNHGDVFLPEFGINQIGSFQPGQGYKLLLSEDAVLLYPPVSGGQNVLRGGVLGVRAPRQNSQDERQGTFVDEPR